MKKSNYELIVGGVIFISLFILISGVLWLKEVRVARKMVKYTVLFPNIGTLQEGDPLTVNGVKKGIVSKIGFYKSQVSVVLKIDKDVVFTDSSKVTVQNIGLMGERQVGILLSEMGTPYKPDTKNNVTYIKGYFDSGIAEAMGMLGDVLNEVLALVDTVEQIIDKTVGNAEFVDFFQTIVHRIDTIVYLVDNLVEENAYEINAALDNIHTMTADLKNLVETNKSNMDNILVNGAQLTSSALVIADRIDSIVVSVNRIVSDIEAGKGSIGMLVEDETVIKDLQKSLIALDSLVTDVNENGLKLRVKFFGNRKYFKKKKKSY